MYWQFLGTDFEIEANEITGTIKLPKDAENKESIRVWGHTPDLNGTIYATSNNTIEFEVKNNKAKKMVEVRIAMPNGIIESSGRTYNVDRLNTIIQEETGWANDANSSRIFKLVISIIICTVIFGILIYFLVKNILIMKNTKKVLPTQDYEYYRDLPRKDATPAEALYILENRYRGFYTDEIGKVFSATLLNLSLKKAIKFEKVLDEKGKDSSVIEILIDNIENVTNKKDEILVFNFIEEACKNKIKKNINENTKTITMKELKKYIERHSTEVITLQSNLDSYMKKNLLAKNILDEEGIKRRKKITSNTIIWFLITFFGYFFLADIEMVTDSIESIGIHWIVICIMVILVIIDLILGSIAKNKVSVYTQEGTDEQNKWRALKKYMEDFSLLKEKDVPDLVIWEKFLVYATAFGISEKVIKQLKIVYPDYDSLDYSIYPNMYILMHMNFASSFNSISNSMSSTFSSGSGMGGGFSGGGGFRRRPEEAEVEDNLQSLIIKIKTKKIKNIVKIKKIIYNKKVKRKRKRKEK